MDSVTPAQWCVFSFGMDTSRSAPTTVSRQVQLAERRERAARRHGAGAVVVQVHVAGARLRERVVQPGGGKQVVVVATVPRPLGDGDGGGAERAERLDGGRDQRGVRVDRGVRVELDEVRLDHHALPAHVDAEQPDPVADGAGEARAVLGGVRARRRGRTAVFAYAARVQRGASGRSRAQRASSGTAPAAPATPIAFTKSRRCIRPPPGGRPRGAQREQRRAPACGCLLGSGSGASGSSRRSAIAVASIP